MGKLEALKEQIEARQKTLQKWAESIQETIDISAGHPASNALKGRVSAMKAEINFLSGLLAQLNEPSHNASNTD